MIEQEIIKNGDLFEHDVQVTEHLNRVFGGLVKAVYIPKNPTGCNLKPRFTENGYLDLSQCKIYVLFNNDALVCFWNSEWGGVDDAG
jgi:hypothetical protein